MLAVSDQRVLERRCGPDLGWHDENGTDPEQTAGWCGDSHQKVAGPQILSHHGFCAFAAPSIGKDFEFRIARRDEAKVWKHFFSFIERPSPSILTLLDIIRLCVWYSMWQYHLTVNLKYIPIYFLFLAYDLSHFVRNLIWAYYIWHFIWHAMWHSTGNIEIYSIWHLPDISPGILSGIVFGSEELFRNPGSLAILVSLAGRSWPACVRAAV